MEVNPYQSPRSSTAVSGRASPSSTVYTVRCGCGRDVTVSKSDAGGEVDCTCGNRLRIPRLSELRRFAGEDPYALSTIERIRKMVAAAELPGGGLCQVSYKPTSDVLYFTIECETPYTRQHSWWLLLLLAMTSFIAYWRASRDESPAMGREVFIDVPIRIGHEHHQMVRRFSQRKLRDLMNAEPIYAQLLQEYPQAWICPRSAVA